MKPIHAILVLSATLLLAACGFHLRKGVNLPADLGPLRVVSSSRYSPLAESLAQALARSGAIPAPDPVDVSVPPEDAQPDIAPSDDVQPDIAPPEDAQSDIAPPNDANAVVVPPTPVATLNIRKERWGTIPAAIDARGRAQELTLRYAVEFDLLRADGSVLVPRQVVELARNYVTVPNNSIGTDSEQDLLAKEMRRDMVAAVMRRIDIALQTAVPIDDGTVSPGTPPEAPEPQPAETTAPPPAP